MYRISPDPHDELKRLITGQSNSEKQRKWSSAGARSPGVLAQFRKERT